MTLLSRASRIRLACAGLFVVVCLVAGKASADPIPTNPLAPTVLISDGNHTFNIPRDTFEFDPDSGFFSSEGDSVFSADGVEQFKMQWNIQTNPDPSVSGSWSIVNFTALTQTYTITFIQPITPAIFSPTVTQGSVAINVQDVLSATGATVSNAMNMSSPIPIYTASMDGSVQQTLLNSGVNLVSNSMGEITGTSASFTNVLGPPVSTDLSIEIKFRLTSHDLSTGTAYFEVVPVPEPSSMTLAIVGLIGLAGWCKVRRRVT